MNILFIQHSGSVGGAPKSLALLSRACMNNGHVVTTISMRKGLSNELLKKSSSKFLVLRKLFPFHATEVSGISMKTKLRNVVGLIFNLFSFWSIKKESPDIIYLNSSCNCASILVFKALYPRVPVITHIREPLLTNIWGDILNKMVDFVSDQVVAISDNDAHSLTVNCDVEVIYNSTEIPSRYNYDIGCNEWLTVAYVARVSEENGLLEFINACLTKDVKGIKLLLCGFSKIPNSYEIDILERVKKINYVEVVNQVEDVSTIYLNSDILISPFKKPHFSRSVIEAASYGVPSVITDVGSQNELVVNGETGYLCKSAEEMLVRLTELSKNRSILKSMSSNAREMAKLKFDSNKSILQNIKLIERVLHV